MLAAERNHRSMNAELVQRLLQTLGPDRRVEAIFEALELPRVMRLRASNTTADVNRVLAIAGTLAVDRLVLGARPDPLNNATLVILLQTASLTFLMDQTSLNLARRPRQLDVRELMRGLDEFGLLKGAEYAPKLLPNTTELAPDDAAGAILKAGNLKALPKSGALPKIGVFLTVLAAGTPLELDEKEFVLGKR